MRTTIGLTGPRARLILNHMVKLSDAPLDRTFAGARRSYPPRAGDAARRRARPVGERACRAVRHLAAGDHEASRCAVGCGLVDRTKTGRTVACRLDAEPMRDAFEWLNRYEKFWSERLSSLAAYLRGRIMSTETVTKPSLTLKRRIKAPPAKVFAAWIDPEKVKHWMGPGERQAGQRSNATRATAAASTG